MKRVNFQQDERSNTIKSNESNQSYACSYRAVLCSTSSSINTTCRKLFLLFPRFCLCHSDPSKATRTDPPFPGACTLKIFLSVLQRLVLHWNMEAVRRKGASNRRSRRIPRNVSIQDPGLSQKYFTRRHSSQISTNDVRILFCSFPGLCDVCFLS